MAVGVCITFSAALATLSIATLSIATCGLALACRRLDAYFPTSR
jgi:hypothetical protein